MPQRQRHRRRRRTRRPPRQLCYRRRFRRRRRGGGGGGGGGEVCARLSPDKSHSSNEEWIRFRSRSNGGHAQHETRRLQLGGPQLHTISQARTAGSEQTDFGPLHQSPHFHHHGGEKGNCTLTNCEEAAAGGRASSRGFRIPSWRAPSGRTVDAILPARRRARGERAGGRASLVAAVIDNATSARGIVGLMLPRGRQVQPKGQRPEIRGGIIT